MPRLSTKIQRDCEHCGRPFLVKQTEVNRGWGRFCSVECQRQAATIPLEDRFFDYVGSKTTSGCILWKGRPDRGGYGKITNRRRTLKAHRVAYELLVGPIPDGLDVLHHCDNPPCVNPTHLFLGTDADNVADMVAKGRHAYGERNGQSKLTAELVHEIRLRHQAGERQKDISEAISVTSACISDIVLRKRWRHVD